MFLRLRKNSLILHLIEPFLPTVLVKFVTLFFSGEPNVPVLSRTSVDKKLVYQNILSQIAFFFFLNFSRATKVISYMKKTPKERFLWKPEKINFQ